MNPRGIKNEQGHCIFLLSPARVSGRRGKQLVNATANFELARRLREGGVPLAEIFSFISGLYFRGKVAYSSAFSRPPAGINSVYVITACGGLVPAGRIMTSAQLQKICAGEVHEKNTAYRMPLVRDMRRILNRAGANCEFVLLGSIATSKYVEPLLGILGERLLFPAEFVGRGDMSRGGLMLRSARSNVELAYVAVATAQRHGARPPKLPRIDYAVRASAATA